MKKIKNTPKKNPFLEYNPDGSADAPPQENVPSWWHAADSYTPSGRVSVGHPAKSFSPGLSPEKTDKFRDLNFFLNHPTVSTIQKEKEQIGWLDEDEKEQIGWLDEDEDEDRPTPHEIAMDEEEQKRHELAAKTRWAQFTKRRHEEREGSFCTFDTETKDGLLGKELFCWSLCVPEKGGQHEEKVFSVLTGEDRTYYCATHSTLTHHYRAKHYHTPNRPWFTPPVKPYNSKGREDLNPMFRYFRERFNAPAPASYEKIDPKTGRRRMNPNKKPIVVYVHNLGFDVRFIVDYCMRYMIPVKPIISGSNCIALSIQTDYMNVRFVDTYQYLFSTQEKAEQTWDVPETYTKLDCGYIFNTKYVEWTPYMKVRVVAHNKNDVIALRYIMLRYRQSMLDIAGVDIVKGFSLAGMALKALRVELPQNFSNPFIKMFSAEGGNKKINFVLDKVRQDFCRKSYFGGRTECFTLQKCIKMAYVDVVSMYPAMMQYENFPHFLHWVVNHQAIDNALKRGEEGVIECTIRIDPREKYPIFPYRYNDRVMFTTCTRRWVYTTPEIRYALERNEVVFARSGYRPYTIEFHKAMLGEATPIFAPFVSKFFKIKSSTSGGTRYAAKITLNSPYGKMGENPIRRGFKLYYFNSDVEAMEFVEQQLDSAPDNAIPKHHIEYFDALDVWGVMSLEHEFNLRPYMNVVWSSMVSAHGRICLTRQIHRCEHLQIPVAYCDTDSVVVPQHTLPQFELGKELGDWDIEELMEEFKAFAPKCYIKKLAPAQSWEADGGFILKMKGIEKEARERIVNSSTTLEEIEAQIRQPIQLAEKYMTLKAALRKGHVLTTRVMAKHYSMENSKRNFTDDGVDSFPWNDENLPQHLRKGIPTAIEMLDVDIMENVDFQSYLESGETSMDKRDEIFNEKLKRAPHLTN